MKKLLAFLLFALLSVLFTPAALAGEPIVLPDAIRDFFCAPSFDGMMVLDRVNGIEMGGTDA